jgi:hypothetical protein
VLRAPRHYDDEPRAVAIASTHRLVVAAHPEGCTMNPMNTNLKKAAVIAAAGAALLSAPMGAEAAQAWANPVPCQPGPHVPGPGPDIPGPDEPGRGEVLAPGRISPLPPGQVAQLPFVPPPGHWDKP